MYRHDSGRWLRIVLLISAASLCISCARGSIQSERDFIPAGSPMEPFIRFQFAIYYLPTPSRDPLVVLRELLATKESPPTLIDELPEQPDRSLVHARLNADVQTEYAPPDVDLLQYFGHGLTPEQAEQLQESRQAFLMDFAHPKEGIWESMRAATEIAESLARETDGLLWDEETREVFTPDEWHRKRVASWNGRAPDVSKHITIHSYKSDEYVRAITLGMKKFGLPDLVVEGLAWSISGQMASIINVLGQSMAEGAVIEKPGELDLDLREIENEEVRDSNMGSLKSDASGVALLTLTEGVWEEGDPLNRLIEIGFDRHPGRDVHARQAAMLSSLFGWEDSTTPVVGSDELLAASQSAKTRLPVLYEAFSEGLAPGEYILVKAPFETPAGGREWMWVEITAWEGSTIEGTLANEPLDVPSLHSGQIVEVSQEDVFDYLRHYSDGREEGNETGAIIERMQQQNDKK